MPNRSNHKRGVTAALLALAVSGCAGNARPAQPTASVPAAPTTTTGPTAVVVVTDPFLCAIEHAPAVRAARAQVLAARFGVTASGALADPRLNVTGKRHVVDVNGSSNQHARGLEFALDQELPRWGERSAARAGAAAIGDMAQAELDQVRGELAEQVAIAAAEAEAARARQTLAAAEATRVRTLIDALTAALAGGGGADASSVRALRTRLEAADLAQSAAVRDASDSEDDARAQLGLAASMPMPTPPEPLGSVGMPTDLGTASTDTTPAVRMATAQARSAAAEAQAARSRRYPAWSVGLGWEREDLNRSDDDAWNVSLGVSLPIWQEARAADEAAARVRVTAAEHLAVGARARVAVVQRRQQRAVVQAAAASAAAASANERLEADLERLRARLSSGAEGAVLEWFARLDALSDAQNRAVEARLVAARASAALWPFAAWPQTDAVSQRP